MKKVNSLEADFFKLYKLSQLRNDSAAWQAALNKINSVSQDSTLSKIIDKLIVASKGIPPMLEAIQKAGITPEQLSGLFRMGKGLGAVTASGIDIQKIEKFSAAYMAANKMKRERLLKQAGITETLGEYAGKISEGLGSIPGTIAKLLPYARVIYQGVTSVMSLLSAFNSFQALVGEAETFGLKWHETLLPWKLKELLPNIKDDPNQIGSLGYICAVGAKVIEEGLVGIIRAVVVLKKPFDILMNVLSGQEVAATGLLGSLKPFLPLLQVLIEWGAANLLSAGHKSLLEEIMQIINSHLGTSASMSQAPMVIAPVAAEPSLA